LRTNNTRAGAPAALNSIQFKIMNNNSTVTNLTREFHNENAIALDTECRHRRQRPARLQLAALTAVALSALPSGLRLSEDLEKLPRNHKGYVRTKYDLEAIEKARVKQERKAAAKAARVEEALKAKGLAEAVRIANIARDKAA
jgi:hypothetical protein